jgi:hypothetical protein
VNSTTRAAQKGALRGVSAVQKAGGIKALLKSPIATGVGTATVSAGAAIAGAAALGIAAFMATTYVLNQIRDRKERARQAAFEAGQAFRKARLDAEKRLRRKLSIPELQELHTKFTVGLTDRGW